MNNKDNIEDVIANGAQRNAAICQGLFASIQEIASLLGVPRSSQLALLLIKFYNVFR